LTSKPSPTVFISAGGTGGGIYPALTALEALRRVAPNARYHFIGSPDGMEGKLVPREGLAGYHTVQAGPIHGLNPLKQAVSAAKILIGIGQTWALAGRLRPAALLLTGGWVTFPVAVGCWLRRVPVVVYLPDIEPALVIRAVGRLARRILTPVPESAAYFPPNAPIEVVGYPLRQRLITAERAAALAHRTLLVFCGSRGARSINTAIGAIVPDLVADGVQIIHISGELDWPTVQARRETLPESVRQHYHAYGYLRDEMGLALAAADLAVSRAGASTIGEFPHFGLPSVLVPYPYAWRYQKVNADWLAERGAAIRLDDERLGEDLLPTLRALLNDAGRLAAMAAAARSLARPNAADSIARAVLAACHAAPYG